MNKIELTNYQKSNISSPKIGTVVFQTDGDIGYYEYTKNGWVKLIQENMNEYERNKNGRKWLIGVNVFILIGTAFLVTQAVIIIKESYRKEQSYKQGYHDARTLYECDHDRAECEMLKD